MIEQVNNSVRFFAFFTATKQGKTGLTVTVDVYRGTTQVVTAGSASALGGGLYYYDLSSGSVNAEENYLAIFKTSDSTVDFQHVPSMWSVGKAGIENLDSSVSGVQSDTNDIQSRLPSALVSGRMDASIGAAQADVITASSLATDAVTEIATGVWGFTIRTGFTALKVLRIMAAALFGKISNADNTPITIRSIDDSKDEIVAAVDSDGNRTSVTVDGT